MKKRFAFFVVLIYLVSYTQAQTGVMHYEDFSLYGMGYGKVVPCSDGGYIGVGNSGIIGHITKFNGNFNVLWSYKLDSVIFIDAIETNDGNYVLEGLSYRTTYQNNPVHIVKMSSTGTVIFQKRYHDATFANAFTVDGICKAAGTDQGFIMYGGNCIAAQYAIKCDANGIVQWEKNNLGMGNGSILTMVPDGNGYVGAFSWLSNSMIHGGIIRLDASGNLVACKTFQTVTSVQMGRNCLAKLSNGNFVVMTKPNDISGVALFTVDPTFATITCNRISTTSSFYVDGMFATHNSNDEVIICGSYGFGYGSALQVNSATASVSFAKSYNTIGSGISNGTKLANGNYLLAGGINTGGMLAVIDNTGSGFCTAQNISLSPELNYSFTPASPTITQYPIGVATLSVNDVLVSENLTTSVVCGTLSSTVELSAEQAIDVFPNPTQNQITISANSLPIESVRVLNIAGQEIERINAQGQNRQTIDLSSYDSGIYFIEIITSDRRFVRRIIRE
jgi:Secretion system C-terminal sorting domain